jgi:hypothetical protein
MEEDTKSLILSRKALAEDYLSTKRGYWDEYESLFNGKLEDAVSQGAKSQVFDHKLSTQIMERSARVMAQLPVGKVKAISKNDEGASKMMNLIIEKYVLPNANSQYDFLTKTRMTDLYSNMYGNFFAMVDWIVKEDGYVGPDLYLLPIRDVFPQVGAVSLEDSDYVIVRTWRPLSWFKTIKKDSEFKNMSKIIAKLEKKTGDKTGKDTSSKSKRENTDYPTTNEAKGKGYFEVLSMYEKDKWTDYVPAADEIMREIDNPHENGELPVVNKYSIPMLDDFMGMGDFERGKSMQYFLNGLWNLYSDAVRVSIFPPVLLDKDAIADTSSIKWAAAAKWLMNKGGAQSGAQVMNLTPQGTNTFNSTYQMVTASLMNMFGTTDTSITKESGPEFGKTPQALQMQASRENARDTVDRFYMEQFLTKIMKKFCNLLSKKLSGSVTIRMFQPEIDEIAIQYPEINEMYNEKTGKLNINKSKVASQIYDYEIVSGSTFALDQKQQQENLMSLMNAVKEGMTLGPNGVTSPLLEALKKEGKTLKVGELFTRIVSNSGIQDWDKIIVETKDDPDAQVQQNDDMFMRALQEAGGVGNIPTEGMGGMPQGMPPQQPQGMPPTENYEPGIETNQF